MPWGVPNTDGVAMSSLTQRVDAAEFPAEKDLNLLGRRFNSLQELKEAFVEIAHLYR